MSKPRPSIDMRGKWSVDLRYLGGFRPWHAFITKGIMRMGEPGSTTYASKTPERALSKALHTIARMAPADHPERIVIEIDRDDDWAKP